MLLILGYLALLAHGSLAVWVGPAQEPPPADWEGKPPADWGGGAGARVTVEAEAEQLTDRVRFTYTVRNINASLHGSLFGIESVLVGALTESAPSELTAAPLEIESPPGWEAKLLADDRASPRTWRIQWSCGQRGREHSLKYHIKTGTALTGFRVSAPLGDSSYLTASYAAWGDRGGGGGLFSGSGKVGVKRARPSK